MMDASQRGHAGKVHAALDADESRPTNWADSGLLRGSGLRVPGLAQEAREEDGLAA